MIFRKKKVFDPQGNPVDVMEADAMKTFKKVFGTVALVIAIVAALSVLTSVVVVTYPNQYKMVIQFGKIVRVQDAPGISFKVPVIQSVRTIPKEMLLYDLPISDVITKDKKTMVADSFVLWKIQDPIKFSQTLNGSITNAEARISAIVYNSMKNVISSMTQTEMISGRDKLAVDITAHVGTGLEQYGISLVGVETKRLDLPDDNKNAVYERMISERNNIAASYQAQGESEAKKIRTETDAAISIKISEAQAKAADIVAQGEAEYMKILSAAYDDAEKADFYEFVRSLDAAKAGLTGDNNTLILSKDSPIAQIFYGDGQAPVS